MRTLLFKILLATAVLGGVATSVSADAGGGLPPLYYPGSPQCPVK
jgi:hypothetical protein